MVYQAKQGQVFYGHTIGILMLDTFVPLIPGDVGNATTYTYPVLYKKLTNVTAKKLVSKDPSVLPEIISKGKQLVQDGAKVITGDCGFMVLYQEELRKELNVPVFLSSLLQLPFIFSMLNKKEKVGVVTADSNVLDRKMLRALGVENIERIKVNGMEMKENFYEACIAEQGTLNKMEIEKEVIEVSKNMVEEDSNIKAILLECSFLPPYSKSVQETVNIPVFDYKTMIDFVHSAYHKPFYNGYL